MKYYIPILITQAYLIFTLFLFQFGPISFYIEYPLLFWWYIFLYQASFFLGYLIACRTKRKNYYKYGSLGDDISTSKFWLLIITAMIASMISFKGVAFFDLINPFYWYTTAMSGIENPGEQYIKKMERVLSSENTGNKLLNIFYFVVAFSKILIIPALVILWHRLSYFTRFFALFVSALPVLIGFSNGTNKQVFDFTIFYGVSLAVFFIKNFYSLGSFGFKKRKFFVLMIFLSGLCAISFFGLTMQERGGSAIYIETVSPLGHIEVKEHDINTDDDFAYSTYVWFTSYLVQGYYGFSLSLSQDFTSTLGFGNSPFLTRQFEWVTGMNLSNLTYQHKIDQWWDETAQWHSFYSYFANDFHFLGVSFICLLFGFYLARLWLSIINNNNFYAVLIMPLFALLVIFIPANNQVFGFLETFSAFWVTSILWFYVEHIKSFRSLHNSPGKTASYYKNGINSNKKHKKLNITK